MHYRELNLKLCLLCIYLIGAGVLAEAQEFKTKLTSIALDEKGFYKAIKVDDKDLLADGRYPVVSVMKKNQILLPIKTELAGQKLRITMEDGQQVELKVEEGEYAITYEVTAIAPDFNLLLFGPFKVTPHEVVGEVVGVAQHGSLAFAMQSLNIKTVAGIPDGDAAAYSKRFQYVGSNSELSVESIPYYRAAAVDVKDGTVYQLGARNRQQTEYRKVQQVENVLTLPVNGPDGEIVGAKVALFGDKRTEILNRIGRVEVAYGLPHPIIEGEWDKLSRASMRSYLITNFSEQNMDFVLDKVEKAGFKNLYHPDPFQTWGHFSWKDALSKTGDEGIKDLVERAKLRGINLGLHTLTNFLTTNDEYVTPVPSKNLLKQGELKLAHRLDPAQTTIEIAYSNLFDVPLSLNALQVGDELITFGRHEKQGDHLRLLDCVRGAFGTQASAHNQEEVLYKLWDYPYKTLFPDLKLQDEFAHRLSAIFNQTGVRQISFDGLEGSMYTGHDYYATARFVTTFYNGLEKTMRENLINDASRLDHFLWHIHTRMNWGEPWGEEMRKGQVENRIKNQAYFQRNLFPRMLGWFLVRLAERRFEATTMEDLEWALSESAGFDAGYAMSINVKTLEGHGQIDQLLEAMKNWDALRIADVFSDDQKRQLKDPETEWHLEKINAHQFLLYPLFISDRFRCDLSEMQPGQPSGADWSWYAPTENTYALRIKVEGVGAIANPSFTTPNGRLRIEGMVKAGQYILLDYDGKATLTDQNYNVLEPLTVQGTARLPQGSSAVAFSCDSADGEPEVVVRYIVRSAAEEISLP